MQYPTDVEGDAVTLTLLDTDDHEGWSRVRPSASTKTAARSEVEQLFEYRCLSTFRGLRVRVVAMNDREAHLQFEPGDTDAIFAAGGHLTDSDVFEAIVPTTSISQPEYYAVGDQQ